MKKILFLDTNVFVQCKDLKQLPWAELCKDDEELLLLIPSVVQEEIDKHKQEGNTRRGKRARKASAFIRQIILSDQTSLVISSSKPFVRISFPSPSDHPCSLPDFLDLSRPDNRLIADILRYKSAFPEDHVAFLTHDTNPLLTAKRCGISYHIVPDDWLLPPEPDSKDRKISELENRVKELESNYPVVEVSTGDMPGSKIERFSAETVKYKPLTDGELNELLDQIMKRYPMKTNFDQDFSQEFPKWAFLSQSRIIDAMTGVKREFEPPDFAEIEKYQREQYPAWVENVKKYLLGLPVELEQMVDPPRFSIMLANNGSVPAENIVVEFSAMGKFFFTEIPDDDTEKKKKNQSVFPTPPKAPQGRWVTRGMSAFDPLHLGDARSLLEAFSKPSYLIDPLERLRIFHSPSSLLGPLPKRDRNRFYWKSGRSDSPSKKWVFECEEFRHKIKEEMFEMILVAPRSEQGLVEGAIKCSVSARNLPEPVILHIPVTFVHVEGDTLAAIKKHLGDNIFRPVVILQSSQ